LYDAFRVFEALEKRIVRQAFAWGIAYAKATPAFKRLPWRHAVFMARCIGKHLTTKMFHIPTLAAASAKSTAWRSA
jgi:hypothetical protein